MYCQQSNYIRNQLEISTNDFVVQKIIDKNIQKSRNWFWNPVKDIKPVSNKELVIFENDLD